MGEYTRLLEHEDGNSAQTQDIEVDEEKLAGVTRQCRLSTNYVTKDKFCVFTVNPGETFSLHAGARSRWEVLRDMGTGLNFHEPRPYLSWVVILPQLCILRCQYIWFLFCFHDILFQWL